MLIRLSRLHQVERLPAARQKQIEAEVHRAHTGIARSIEARDAEAAQRRMRRHLEALGVVISG